MEPPIIQAGFQPGHRRFAGRARKSVALAREIAERLDIDPLEVMLRMVKTGMYEALEVGARGAEHKVKRPLSADQIIDLLKTVAGYYYPKLSALAVTGRDGGPIETSSVSATILMTPALSDAMQTIAFAAAEADARERLISPSNHAANALECVSLSDSTESV
jgi:hypothetical protein